MVAVVGRICALKKMIKTLYTCVFASDSDKQKPSVVFLATKCVWNFSENSSHEQGPVINDM